MKLDWKTIGLAVSVLLNILGGTSVVPPVVKPDAPQAPSADCPPGTPPVTPTR